MAAYLTLTAYEVAGSINIPNNTSQAYVELTITTNNGTWNQSGTTTGSITIEGSTTSLNGAWVNKNTTTTLYTGTHTFVHNADGSKSISISASNFRVTSTTTATGVSRTLTLSTIPRASTVSGGSGTIGSTTTINLNRYYDAFTHDVTYSFDGLEGTIATGLQANSVSWTIPTSFYQKVLNASSGVGTISCKTYDGSTQIGSTQTCQFTASVDEATNKPTVALSLTVNNPQAALTGDANKLIANYSNVTATGTSTPKNYATISSNQLKNGDTAYSGTTTTFNAVTSGSFSFTATDSRGLSNSTTTTRQIVAYVKPTISMSVPVINALGEATFEVQGSFFNGSFGAASNTLTVQYRYKQDGGDYVNWQNATVTDTDNTYRGSVSHNGLDYTKAYYFQCRVIDSLQTITSTEIKVKSVPVFDWGEDDFQFHCDVDVAGELTVNGQPIDIDILRVYPIGSIYLSVDSTSPASLFGGTWERIAEGRALFGAGTCDSVTYTAGTTVDKGLPNITGGIVPPLARWYAPALGYSGAFYPTDASVSKYVGSYGPEGNWRNGLYFDASRSNSIYGSSTTVQPNAFVVYMWKRTA